MENWKFWTALIVGILWAAVSSYFDSKARRNRDLSEGNY